MPDIECSNRYCYEPEVGGYIYAFPLNAPNPERWLCESHLFEALKTQRARQEIEKDRHLYENHPRPSELLK